MTATRRDARELALRVLYQIEVGKHTLDEAIAAAIDHAPTDRPFDERTRQFFLQLARGAYEQRSEIDRALGELTTDWPLDRLAIADHNILRLGAFEILFLPDIPAGASINEAVELAKKYSTADSGRFVNGVLGALAKRHPKPSDAEAEEADGGADS